MFSHNFKYSFKTLFRNKMLIFWTFAFPIVMATFFYLAFSNIENSEKLSIIDIAIVETDEFKNNTIMSEAFKNLSDEKNEDRLFNIKYVSSEEANNLLINGDITGYLLLEEDNNKVVIMQSGVNETILKFVVEEIEQTSKMAENLSSEQIENEIKNGNYAIDYEKIYVDVMNIINENDIKIKDNSNKNLSYTMIEFYTLIAMACLYGGMLGMVSINYSLANISSKGKRVSVSSISKGKLILSNVLASFLTQLIGLFLLFVYTIFVLHVNYGTNLLFIIILAIVGSLAGLSLGVVIATLLKIGDGAKTGILIAVTMLGCYLSGMMGITMKYIIDKNVPIINKINPASMITDGFYSLYYYDTYNRFFINVISLLIFSFIMIVLSYRGLRRQKYDSI